MAYTLDEVRRRLPSHVRKRLQDLLMNDDFVAAHCGPNAAVGANLLSSRNAERCQTCLSLLTLMQRPADVGRMASKKLRHLTSKIALFQHGFAHESVSCLDHICKPPCARQHIGRQSRLHCHILDQLM